MSLFCLLAAVAKYPGLGDRHYNSIQSTAPAFRNRSLIGIQKPLANSGIDRSISARRHVGSEIFRYLFFMHAPASDRLQNLSLVEGGGEKRLVNRASRVKTN